MKSLSNYGPSIGILIAGVISLILTFFANKDDSEQKNRIEELGNINKELGRKNAELGNQIKDLHLYSQYISETTRRIVEENEKLSRENIKITTEARQLILEVQKSNQLTHLLVDKIDLKTDKEFAQNLIAGQLEIKVQAIQNERPIIYLGGGTMDEHPVIGGQFPFEIEFRIIS